MRACDGKVFPPYGGNPEYFMPPPRCRAIASARTSHFSFSMS
jgi:hypothetical protein